MKKIKSSLDDPITIILKNIVRGKTWGKRWGMGVEGGWVLSDIWPNDTKLEKYFKSLQHLISEVFKTSIGRQIWRT